MAGQRQKQTRQQRLEQQTDATLQALSHQVRRRILDIVRDQPGCSVSHVVQHFDTSRIAIMKHLRVLEETGLLVTEKEGRVRKLYHNLMPIQLIYDRWTADYGGFWASHLADLKYRVEASNNNKRKKQ